MKLHSGHYILALVALVTATVAGFGFFFLYSHIVGQAQNSAHAVRAVGLETERKQQEGQILKIYEETQADRTKIFESLVQEDEIVQFIEEVEKIGPASSTTLELSALTTGEGLIQAHLNIKGSWSGVMRALTLIENVPYSITLKDLRLTSSERLWNLDSDFSVLKY
ncbi:MAG: hypothetical protein V4697_03740 [Patescibacteria group bacterium]